MKLKFPNISLQRPSPYQPGDLLEGTVSWKLERATKVKYIRLIFIGQCKVKWKKGSGDDEKTYKSHEVYFERALTLHGNAEGRDVSLAAGDFRSPFQFQLPSDVPSSFSSKHGNVWYSIILQASYSGAFTTDDSYNVYIIVVNPVAGHTQCPIRLAKEKTDSGCFSSGNYIKFEVTTDKNMYKPSEPVVLNGYVMNGSPDQMKNVKLILKQAITVYGRRSGLFGPSGSLKQKQNKYIVAEWKGGEVQPRGTLNLSNSIAFRMPDLPETELRYCQFIDVRYFLTFKAALPGFFSFSVSSNPVELVIGNGQGGSIRENPQAIPSAPPSEILNMNPSAFGPDGAAEPPPLYLSMAESSHSANPPSYGEAIGYVAAPVPTASYTQPSTTTEKQGTYYDWSQSAFSYT